jgi:hypothetical protein
VVTAYRLVTSFAVNAGQEFKLIKNNWRDNMKIFFIIDVSDSMIPKLEFINSAMKEVIFDIKNMGKIINNYVGKSINRNVRILNLNISLMSFSSDIK